MQQMELTSECAYEGKMSVIEMFYNYNSRYNTQMFRRVAFLFGMRRRKNIQQTFRDKILIKLEIQKSIANSIPDFQYIIYK